jgi:hypothetical protein
VLDSKLVWNFMTIAVSKFQQLCTFLLRVMQFLTQFGLLSKQLDRFWERKLFEHLNVGILSSVEYQSCTEYCDDRAHQNSAFFHKGSENYGIFDECQHAAGKAR